MQFTIEILAVTAVTKPTAKGSYVQLDVAYKRDGKTEGKKIMSFTSKDVYNALKDATNGQVYTITSEKNEKSGYWDWVGASAGNASTSAPKAVAAGNAAPKSTYETAEERAKKQVYIVRQSSISAAVELLKTEKKQPTPEEVVEVARFFESYVFDSQKSSPVDITELEDDIPL